MKDEGGPEAPGPRLQAPASSFRRPSSRGAALLLLLLSAWLRFYRLGYQSYWNDEGNSLGLAGRSVGAILQAAAADIHPPGYYLALRAWHAATGSSELALRGFSALAGLVLVALLYRLGREYFGRGAALAAALLGAFHPFLIYYAQEARMYALLATLGAGSFLLFSLWLRSSRPPASPLGRWRLGLAYAVVTALGLYTHYAFGFVLAAENVAALGGLLAHRAPGTRRLGQPPAWLLRLGAWVIWQGLAILLFVPWLPVAWRQLTTWPAAREFQRFGTAVVSLARYLTFGRTLTNAEAGLGLAGAAVLLAFGLRRRGQSITPLLWLLIPAGLTLGFGLLSEAFSKFLLVAVPAACLLLGQGLAAMPRPRSGQPETGQRPVSTGTQRLGSWLALGAWLAALGAYAAATFTSLNHLYFDPAYFRDDYRGIAQHLAAIARPDDAVITIAPNQVEAFGYYHTGGAVVYPLPHSRPLDPGETEAALAGITARHPRVFVLFWGDEQADPGRLVETWLNTHAFKAGEAWYGQVRLATYAAASAPAVSAVSGARFGEHVTLEGYALNAQTLAPGDILQLTLFWSTDSPLEERYKVFVHLYTDVDQPPVAQHDGEPGGGLTPTSTWAPGRRYPDNHGVLIPADLPPGDYTLMLGLYNAFTNARLPVMLDGVAEERLRLGVVHVK